METRYRKGHYCLRHRRPDTNSISISIHTFISSLPIMPTRHPIDAKFMRWLNAAAFSPTVAAVISERCHQAWGQLPATLRSWSVDRSTDRQMLKLHHDKLASLHSSRRTLLLAPYERPRWPFGTHDIGLMVPAASQSINQIGFTTGWCHKNKPLSERLPSQ